MENKVILRFNDEEDFKHSCIDGFKIVIKKPQITLKEIKLIRDSLDENGYYVKNFKIDNDDVLEVEGGLHSMPNIESMYDLVDKVKEEEHELKKILYSLEFLNFKVSLYVSGLY